MEFTEATGGGSLSFFFDYLTQIVCNGRNVWWVLVADNLSVCSCCVCVCQAKMDQAGNKNAGHIVEIPLFFVGLYF